MKNPSFQFSSHYLLFSHPAVTHLSPQPFELSTGRFIQLTSPSHHPMDYDSPDWDRTPTESIEVKDETPHLTKAEAVESSTNDPKLELTKKEEDSPQHTPMLCPPAPTHRCSPLPRPPLATTAIHTHPNGGCPGHRQSFPPLTHWQTPSETPYSTHHPDFRHHHHRGFRPQHMHFPGLQQHLQTNPRSRDWIPALSSPMQRCHHSH